MSLRGDAWACFGDDWPGVGDDGFEGTDDWLTLGEIPNDEVPAIWESVRASN